MGHTAEKMSKFLKMPLEKRLLMRLFIELGMLMLKSRSQCLMIELK